MQVIIARHGYTFGPDQRGGEQEILCGSGQNLPLVERGRAKARQLAEHLQQQFGGLSAIYANHLLRTWEHACIVKEYFHHHVSYSVPLYEDETFLELDYGAWAGLPTGKDNNQVIAQFGEEAWQAWQQRREMPVGMPHNWQITESALCARIINFMTDLPKRFSEDDTVLILASQGSLAFIHCLLDGGMTKAREEQHLKTAPGNFCHLSYQQERWRLKAWNHS